MFALSINSKVIDYSTLNGIKSYMLQHGVSELDTATLLDTGTLTIDNNVYMVSTMQYIVENNMIQTVTVHLYSSDDITALVTLLQSCNFAHVIYNDSVKLSFEVYMMLDHFDHIPMSSLVHINTV